MPLSSGAKLGSYCLTEPNSGSDSQAMRTTAKRDGNGWVINGTKIFISGGSKSDLYLVFCRTGEKEVSTFVVPKEAEGLSFGKPEIKMGWNSSTTTVVNFDNVRVSNEHLLGAPGKGFKMAMSGLNGGRINIGACSLGGAQLALDKTIDYVKQRTQFGKTIMDQQNTQFTLARV